MPAFKNIYKHIFEFCTPGLSWADTLGVFSLNTHTFKNSLAYYSNYSFQEFYYTGYSNLHGNESL